mmetsp:Transcript_57670/g.154083  ORF Transcript_57670/g.154083 Transcript_57670/m.154083 type:complete len:221 (-) Transcript_57670:4-666(-)
MVGSSTNRATSCNMPIQFLISASSNSWLQNEPVLQHFKYTSPRWITPTITCVTSPTLRQTSSKMPGSTGESHQWRNADSSAGSSSAHCNAHTNSSCASFAPRNPKSCVSNRGEPDVYKAYLVIDGHLVRSPEMLWIGDGTGGISRSDGDPEGVDLALCPEVELRNRGAAEGGTDGSQADHKDRAAMGPNSVRTTASQTSKASTCRLTPPMAVRQRHPGPP